MDEDEMLGPGSHETAALNAIGARPMEVEEAKVHAMLAIASAINRLAAAHEANNPDS